MLSVSAREILNLSDGSHLAIYDDQQRYFTGLIDFIRATDTPRR